MKPLILIALLLVGILLYTMLRTEPAPAPTAAPKLTQGDAIWDQPLPEGTEQLPEGAARVHVAVARRNEGGKNYLDFQLSEEHGYMVDGVRVEFWFRFKDEDTGEWIEDTNRIDHLIRERIPFNETLVSSTVLLDLDFRDQGIDLASTTTENWGARVVNYSRAMRRIP